MMFVQHVNKVREQLGWKFHGAEMLSDIQWGLYVKLVNKLKEGGVPKSVCWMLNFVQIVPV